jgi:hypothetical protein
MTREFLIFTLGGLALLAACRATEPGAGVPALITNPTGASRVALQNAVNTATNSTVLIADNALTDSSMLFVERRSAASLQGQPATGRNMEPPIEFRLVIVDSACILIDSRDESPHILDNTSCVAR